MAAMSEASQNQTLADFVTLKNRAGLTHAIRAATELGIFKALVDGQKTAEQLAAAIKADPSRVAALMNVLVQSELIEKYENDYALATLAHLIPETFFDFGDSHWQHLADNVRSGKSIGTGEDDQDFLIQQASEEWMLAPAALTVAQALDIGKTRKGLKILELGCGSAVFGATLAHADPSSSLTLVDTKPEIARAQTTIDAVQVASRTTLIEADDWQNIEIIDLSGDDVDDDSALVPQPVFDLIIVSQKIHLDSLRSQTALMKKIGALLLNRGGELVIVDVFPGQPAGAQHREMFELEFGLRHSHGQCHHPRDLESALKNAGFASVQFAHLPAEPYLYGLVLAAKG
jgi:phospholipid N-methyltransferase